jgi:adenylate kinase
MHNIILLGIQGSGKGTQSDRIVSELKIPTVTLGKLFRAEAASGTGLGRTIAGYTAKGDLVPSDIVTQLMRGRLSEDDTANGVILDGFPRSIEQAKVLEGILSGLGREITDVVLLKISDAEAMRRLSGRRVCTNQACETNYHVDFHPPKGDPNICDRCGSKLEQRKDDTPEAIKHRIEIYHQETEPLIEFYRNHEKVHAGHIVFHEVNGERSIDEVADDLAKLLGVK